MSDYLSHPFAIAIAVGLLFPIVKSLAESLIQRRISRREALAGMAMILHRAAYECFVFLERTKAGNPMRPARIDLLPKIDREMLDYAWRLSASHPWVVGRFARAAVILDELHQSSGDTGGQVARVGHFCTEVLTQLYPSLPLRARKELYSALAFLRDRYNSDYPEGPVIPWPPRMPEPFSRPPTLWGSPLQWVKLQLLILRARRGG